MSRLSRRQTVRSKAGQVYKYRQWDPKGPRIRVKSGYGYEEGSTVKLAFKNGKLTKAGELFKDSILDISNTRERELTLEEFEKYVESRSADNKTTTAASFESHMMDTKYERMLNNMNIELPDIEAKLKEKYGDELVLNGQRYTIAEAVSDYTILSRLIDFNYEEGWSVR